MLLEGFVNHNPVTHSSISNNIRQKTRGSSESNRFRVIVSRVHARHVKWKIECHTYAIEGVNWVSSVSSGTTIKSSIEIDTSIL